MGAALGSEHEKPSGQGVHAVMPGEVANVPLLQTEQYADALWNVKVPTSQGVHTLLPKAAKLPAKHIVGAALPAEQAYPCGQTVQLVVLPALNEPAAHGTGSAAGSTQDEPGGQGVHAVAPGLLEAV